MICIFSYVHCLSLKYLKKILKNCLWSPSLDALNMSLKISETKQIILSNMIYTSLKDINENISNINMWHIDLAGYIKGIRKYLPVVKNLSGVNEVVAQHTLLRKVKTCFPSR